MKHSIRTHERGAAGIKAIVAVIVLGVVVYVAITMVPIYVNHFKLEDKIKEDILFAGQRFSGDLEKQFTARVIRYLDEMGVDYDPKNVRVKMKKEARLIRVELGYERRHKIPGFPTQFQLYVEEKFGL